MLVRYEEYTNDYIRSNKTIMFDSISQFKDWIFNLCDGNYKKNIFIPIPERTDIWRDGPSRIEVNCMWTQNKCYWVHQIESGTWERKIYFSDGKFTDGTRHWNEDMKQLCRDLIERRDHPKFNFG